MAGSYLIFVIWTKVYKNYITCDHHQLVPVTLAQCIILEVAHHGQRVLESLDFLFHSLVDRQVLERCEPAQLLGHLVSAGHHPRDVQITPQLLRVLPHIVSML